MTWPWKRRADPPPVEVRQAGGAGFTDAVTRALVAAAAGGTVADPAATAALEAAAGAYARAFAVADVQPLTPATRALTPATLALLARDVIRRGEHVAVIDVGRAGVTLTPAGAWDVTGGPDPATWTYRCDVFGPSGNRTRLVPAAGVVHARYSVDPARPWAGVGPLGWARLSGRLHAEAEAALADESAGTRGHLLPVPAGADDDPDQVDAEGNPVDPNARLRADIQALKGRTVMVETTAGGWSEGREGAPRRDWQPQRIGADPPQAFTLLRSESALAVLAACGVPVDLLAANAASQRRESWRQFLHGSVQPLGAILADELAAKLDAPGLRLEFTALQASDVQGRARAYRSMVGTGQGPGIEDGEARRLAGLT